MGRGKRCGGGRRSFYIKKFCRSQRKRWGRVKAKIWEAEEKPALQISTHASRSIQQVKETLTSCKYSQGCGIIDEKAISCRFLLTKEKNKRAPTVCCAQLASKQPSLLCSLPLFHRRSACFKLIKQPVEHYIFPVDFVAQSPQPLLLLLVWDFVTAISSLPWLWLLF